MVRPKHAFMAHRRWRKGTIKATGKPGPVLVSCQGGAGFRCSLRIPEWRHQKCAVCKVKVDGVCFVFEDLERIEKGAREAAKARKARAEEQLTRERARLQRMRELKQQDPEEYKRCHKRHQMGSDCPCCDALGISLPNYADEDADGMDSEVASETDSLDNNDRYIEMCVGDEFWYDDMVEDGRRKGRFTWAVHPTQRCLGVWRKPVWWAKYRDRLPEELNAGEQLSEAAREEFEAVYRALRRNDPSPKFNSDAGPPSSSSTVPVARGVLSEAQFRTFQDHLEDLKTTTKPDLLRMLKKNDILGASHQPKSELVNLVAVNRTLGVLEKCVKCRQGQLDFDWQSGQTTCRGHKVGMTGWRHCTGPVVSGKRWQEIPRTPWESGLAPPPGPKAKAKAFVRYREFDFDDFDPYGAFLQEPTSRAKPFFR